MDKRLTEYEFELIKTLLRVSEDREKMLSKFLVEGQKASWLAKKYGYTRSGVYRNVNMAWRTWMEYREGVENAMKLIQAEET